MQAQEGTPNGGDSEADQAQMARMMKLMGQKIEMEIDTTLFSAVSINTYVSENPKVVILAMMVPDSFENSKEKMENNSSKQFKIIETGEKEMNGVNVLFIKGTSEAEGTTLQNTLYCMAVDDETCLMFVGVIDEKADAKYFEAIEKAANSVIKKK